MLLYALDFLLILERLGLNREQLRDIYRHIDIVRIIAVLTSFHHNIFTTSLLLFYSGYTLIPVFGKSNIKVYCRQ